MYKIQKEACQWLYFGYLAAIKTQNGAAMSVGRISTFLDIYIQRDLDKGILTESEAQELIDHMVMKFRMVKFARIPSYNQLFSGDPVWATLEVGGIGMDGRSMVTKNCYRFLHTLENMGPAPEPNLTVLYSSALPENFKKYAAKVSINTSSVQYENDEMCIRDRSAASSKKALEAAAAAFYEITGVVGLMYNRKKDEVPAEVTELVEQRAAAKKAKDLSLIHI